MEKAINRQKLLLQHLNPSIISSQPIDSSISSSICSARNSGAYERNVAFGDDVVIVATAICKAKHGGFKDSYPDDLLTPVLKAVIEKTNIDPCEVGDVIIGTVLAPGSERAILCRMAAFYAGFPESVPIRTVNRQCSSGLQAVADVAACIKAGFYDIGIGAGLEFMTLDQVDRPKQYNPREFLIDGDTSSLWHIAKAIHKLEFSTGVIPNVRAKGKALVRVAEILNSLQTEEPVNTSDVNIPEINSVILLDREVDMVTPMLSQLTYEGLLDEFLHITNGAVEIDASIMGAQEEGKKVKVPLNSSDKLFKEIRDLIFEVVVQERKLVEENSALQRKIADLQNSEHKETDPNMSIDRVMMEAEEEGRPEDPPATLRKNTSLAPTLINPQPNSAQQWVGILLKPRTQITCSMLILVMKISKTTFRSKEGWWILTCSSYDSLSGGLPHIENVDDSRRAVVLVVFIGGMTFAELSTLRFLSSRDVKCQE